MYRYISAIIKVLHNPSWFENGSECNTELVQNGVVIFRDRFFSSQTSLWL